jgi:hypothetical protein
MEEQRESVKAMHHNILLFVLVLYNMPSALLGE